MAPFLPALSLYLYTIVVVGTVAPGDEEPLCDQLRALGVAPIPAYSANMRVLMDSRNYQNLLPLRTGAVWEQVDNDANNPVGLTTNWIQQSVTPCQQSTQVCGFTAGPQNNWLITQLISRTVNGTRLPQVNVMIEFELQGCDTTLNCQRTFNTLIYETSTENADEARNTNNYQQVRRVSPNTIDGSKVNTTVTIDFNTRATHSSFYFAIQDETSCLVITRIIIFYYICPKQTVDLISHPETISPPFPTTNQAGNPQIFVTGYCIENTESKNGQPLILVCSIGGIWSTVPGFGCRCVAGHYFYNETCQPCPAGTYLSMSNDSCSTCPANSVSEGGLAQCTCIEGYYRAIQGEDLPCTRYAGTTESTIMESINSTAGTLTAMTSIISVLALILLAVFTMTLVLLVYIRCHRNCNSQGTPMQVPEATYSTVGPPLLPTRIERNMLRAVHRDHHLTVGHDALQLQPVLNESAEIDSIPVRNSITNMSLPQDDSNTETLLLEHVPITESITEREAHVHETNVAVPQAQLDYGIQTEDNVAYNGQFELGSSNKDATTTQMVANPAYGTDVSIASEVQTQANLAYEQSRDNIMTVTF